MIGTKPPADRLAPAGCLALSSRMAVSHNTGCFALLSNLAVDARVNVRPNRHRVSTRDTSSALNGNCRLREGWLQHELMMAQKRGNI